MSVTASSPSRSRAPCRPGPCEVRDPWTPIRSSCPSGRFRTAAQRRSAGQGDRCARCAGPTCTSARATCRCTGPASRPGTRSSAGSSALGPGVADFAIGDRVGVAWLRHTCGVVPVLPAGRGEPVPGLAVHRLGRRRRLRRIHHGAGGLRLPAAGRLRRRRTRAAAVRGDHRLPRAAAQRAGARRPARASTGSAPART